MDLCAAGPCDPGIPQPDPTDVAAFPCLCSGTYCVHNVDFCPPGRVCDQTSVLPECGGLGEPCCDGLNCNEEIEDVNGEILDLVCSPSLDAEDVYLCTRPDEPVLEQSFGCGGLGEKCCGSGDCASEGVCQCTPSIQLTVQ